MFVVVNAFMYNQILSDGDSSMFAALRKLNHYGADHPVIKLDCVNHAEKRMGTSLRKLLKHQKLGGGTLLLVVSMCKTLVLHILHKS